MPGRGSKKLAKCYIAHVGSYQDWKPSKISQWVGQAGGSFQSKFDTAKTTHLIVSEREWKRQGDVVKQALQFNSERNDPRDKIKIVSFVWLDDSLAKESKSKKAEGAYLWEKLDKARAKQAVGAKDHVGLMSEVFHDSTDRFVDERELKRIAKEKDKELQVRREIEEEERRDNAQVKKQAASFKKGAKKARNEIFSDNHHIYADPTGFHYEVLLTKVDVKTNKNERVALTIYESNAEPHTYATNSQWAATDTQPQNKIIAAVGCEFPVAFRAFKKAFKEHTKVEWDDRVTEYNERCKREKRERGIGTGSDTGTQRGRPVSDSGAAVATEEEAFATAPFRYYPPAFGSKGVLPESQKDKRPEPEHVQAWMSGANGAAPVGNSRDHGNSNGWFDNGTEVVILDTDQEQTIKQSQTSAGANNGSQDFSHIWGGLGDYRYDPLYDGVTPDETNVATTNDSFGINPAIDDSSQPGTQEVGETQIAERAQNELLESMERPRSGQVHSAGAQVPKLNLGSSILGKRKMSPMQDSQEQAKKQKGEVVLDSFDNESYLLASGNGEGTGNVPRIILDDELNPAANGQTDIETQAKCGEKALTDGEEEMY